MHSTRTQYNLYMEMAAVGIVKPVPYKRFVQILWNIAKLSFKE